VQPVTQHIAIYQGDRFDFFFRVRERTWNAQTSQWEPGAYVDLTGKRARAEIRSSPGAQGAALATMHYQLADQVDPNTRGGVLLWLLPVETTTLVDSGVWDCQLETDTAEPTDSQTYIMGDVLVTRQVTV
jgi:hypothetical protein